MTEWQDEEKWGGEKLLTFSETMQGHWTWVLVLTCFYCVVVAGLKDDDLYRELWKLCAGPLVDVPQTGDRVFYFPQGHMEQVCVVVIFVFNLIWILLPFLGCGCFQFCCTCIWNFNAFWGCYFPLLFCSCKHLRIKNWTKKFPISISLQRFFAVLWTFSCWYCCFLPFAVVLPCSLLLLLEWRFTCVYGGILLIFCRRNKRVMRFMLVSLCFQNQMWEYMCLLSFYGLVLSISFVIESHIFWIEFPLIIVLFCFMIFSALEKNKVLIPKK